ncbi:hypothetical protein G7Y79_00022g051930 [Physcia stellaris]|nr:hypothetical protein G7Y79_00022g051930 [Physcia stellaris]
MKSIRNYTMGCFHRLSNLKRHLDRLRPGRTHKRELSIGEPFGFRKDTDPSHYGFHGESDPFSSMSNIIEERESIMKEKLGIHNPSTTSRQCLAAEPPSSTNSRQPTLCGSTTQLTQGSVRWADGHGSQA